MSVVAIHQQLMRKMVVMLKSSDLFLRNSRLAGLLTSFFIFAVVLISGTPVPEAWLIVPGGASGAITASTTRRELVERYGAANVRDQDVEVGEGETEPGTVLFPRDPKRSIGILWKDPETKRSPRFLTIRGNTSRWRTVHQITLGASLKQLEQINGRPFSLSGFGWDYSGTVTSWQGGVLDKDLDANGRVFIRLDYSAEQARNAQNLDQVQGDRPFASDHPVMQKVNPRVYEIMWEFR
jgi:hypothetical protein